MSLASIIKKIYKALVPLSQRNKIRFRMDYYKHKWHYPYSRLFIHYRYQESALPKTNKTSEDFLFSIILPDVSNLAALERSLQSLKLQYYSRYELVLPLATPSPAITKWGFQNIVYTEASNGDLSSLLRSAKGDFSGVLFPNDELTQDCLYEVAKKIKEQQPAMLYTDNDRYDKPGQYKLPNYKPAYSSFTLLSQNYISGFTVFKKSLLREILQDDLQDDQYYDLILKASEKTTEIIRLSSVLYHQYISSPATGSGQSLRRALTRRGIEGEVLQTSFPDIFRVKRKLAELPLISIIVPFKDKPEILKTCLDSILALSTYSDFEFIGISNNSVSPETFTFMKEYEAKDSRIRFYEKNIPFNYSALNNYGVSLAKGEHLILLNNDIEIISPYWIEALLEYSQLPETGAVGAKLYYPDNKVQHAGIVVGLSGVAGNSHKMYKRAAYGFNGRLQMIQNLSAVTAACLMVKKKLYIESGGMDEQNLSVAFNDVDFCLKLIETGYQNIFTPYCEAYHHESISRGLENTPEKKIRLERESSFVKIRHAAILFSGDPFYHPALTRTYEDFSLLLQ